MNLQRVSMAAMGLCLSLVLGLAATVRAEEQAPKKTPYPLTTCVVSGEKLGEMGKPYVIHYKGREVQLCCSACEKKFNKDPEAYLKKLDEAGKAATTQPAKAYYCPMHREVTSDKPGKCPKCGMELFRASPKAKKPAEDDKKQDTHGDHA